MKLGNLQPRFNFKASHNLFIPSRRGKCAIHHWATYRKFTTERDPVILLGSSLKELGFVRSFERFKKFVKSMRNRD